MMHATRQWVSERACAAALSANPGARVASRGSCDINIAFSRRGVDKGGMRKSRSGALRALVIGLVAGAGSLSPAAPPPLRVVPRVLGGLEGLRGGGRPCKKQQAWQSNSAPRGDGIRLALEILNVTLEDMERGRQMGLCGDELPARECMICAGFNVREFSKVLAVE